MVEFVRRQAVEREGQATDGVEGSGSGGRRLGWHNDQRGHNVVCNIQDGGEAADAAAVKGTSVAGDTALHV